MPTSASPRQVFDRLLEGVTGRRWDDLPALYAEDTVVEHPFDLSGRSRRIEGREGIRAHFATAADLPIEMTARDVVVHETADPEVVVAEFAYDVRVTTTGRRFTAPCIFVLRVRDGEIVASRDYANHVLFSDVYAAVAT